ncbi:MAG: hypothetical protein H9W81_13760 [Enterococcus sp.]|nr:hypothetical protein [Enterococcus sp.]
MPIAHKEYLDVRDLAAQFREVIVEFEEQSFTTVDDKDDVLRALKTFYDLCFELSRGLISSDDFAFEPNGEDFVSDMRILATEIENFQNEHSPTLIHEDYFTESIQDLVGDIYGLTMKKMPSFLTIDWEDTADNLRPNYFEVKLDGKTYLAERG